MRRMLSGLLCLAVLSAGCAAGSGERPTPPPPAVPEGRDPISVRFDQADALLARGQARESAEMLLELAAADPRRWRTWDDLSLAYRRLDYLPAAAAAGARALSLKPGEPTAAFNTGVALAMAEKAEEAIPYLEISGTSADALYWLAVAQAAAGPRHIPAARETLQRLLAIYPEDKETRVFLAALDQDLDLDQKPDALEVSPGRIFIRLTAGGAPFLMTWNPLADSAPTAVQIVDGGAPYPLLLIWSPRTVWVYLYNPEAGRLDLLRQIAGSGSWRFSTKLLVVGRTDETLRKSFMEDWGWRGGQFRQVRNWSADLKEDAPAFLPGSPLDLGALLAEFPARALFGDDAVWEAYNRRWREEILRRQGVKGPAYAFLLPVDVGWQVEFWSGGLVLDRFSVALAEQNGTWVIAGIEENPGVPPERLGQQKEWGSCAESRC